MKKSKINHIRVSKKQIIRRLHVKGRSEVRRNGIKRMPTAPVSAPGRTNRDQGVRVCARPAKFGLRASQTGRHNCKINLGPASKDNLSRGLALLSGVELVGIKRMLNGGG